MAATTSASSFRAPNLGPSFGALYLGVVGAAILYGVTNLQVYFYARKYREDRVVLKCIVGFLWLIDTLHVVFIVAQVWHYLIQSFGNYEALLLVTWPHKAQQVVTVIIILVVETLYARRIWKLSTPKTRFWRWIICILGICGYAGTITFLVKVTHLHSFTQSSHIRWDIILAVSVSTVCDVVFAVGLCHLIFISTPSLGMHCRTKTMVWIIIRYVLISGALTSLGSLVSLIFFCVMPGNFIGLAIMFVTTKLYINSYLAMLNARESIRNRGSITNKTMEMSSLEIRVESSQGTQSSVVHPVETRPRNREQSSSGVENSGRTVGEDVY